VSESNDRRKDFQELWDNVTEFIAKSEERYLATDEWRKEVKEQLKEMGDKLNNLPCRERSQIYINIEKNFDNKIKNIYSRINWIWLLILLIVGEIIRTEMRK
jgi:hypothetical protein